mmetsp:Transcript_131525/g.380451  ORF Transcript_131525/g.380451 Transcript_131525/m.380451 type:complete len:383 (-) Transcript_131525:1611-2759(-)
MPLRRAPSALFPSTLTAFLWPLLSGRGRRRKQPSLSLTRGRTKSRRNWATTSPRLSPAGAARGRAVHEPPPLRERARAPMRRPSPWLRPQSPTRPVEGAPDPARAVASEGGRGRSASAPPRGAAAPGAGKSGRRWPESPAATPSIAAATTARSLPLAPKGAPAGGCVSGRSAWWPAPRLYAVPAGKPPCPAVRLLMAPPVAAGRKIPALAPASKVSPRGAMVPARRGSLARRRHPLARRLRAQEPVLLGWPTASRGRKSSGRCTGGRAAAAPAVTRTLAPGSPAWRALPAARRATPAPLLRRARPPAQVGCGVPQPRGEGARSPEAARRAASAAGRDLLRPCLLGIRRSSPLPASMRAPTRTLPPSPGPSLTSRMRTGPSSM